MHFRQNLLLDSIVFAQLFSIMDELHVIQQPDLYAYEKITFIHAKDVGLPFFETPCRVLFQKYIYLQHYTGSNSTSNLEIYF
jgi:hypothetical protein